MRPSLSCWQAKDYSSWYKQKKRAAKERSKLLESVPQELLSAIQAQHGTKQWEQYIAGNTKALNAIVGAVLKVYRTDASVVKELIQQKIKENV